jgi:hypothetical protein
VRLGFPEDAFALHLFLQHAKCLIDVIERPSPFMQRRNDAALQTPLVLTSGEARYFLDSNNIAAREPVGRPTCKWRALSDDFSSRMRCQYIDGQQRR